MNNLQEVLALSTADECIVLKYHVNTDNIRWANSTTTTNGTSEDEDLVVISIINGAVGTATATLSNQLDVKALVAKSEEIARFNQPSEDATPLINEGDSTTTARQLPDTDIASFTKDLESIFSITKDQSVDLFGYGELQTTTIEMLTSSGIHKINTNRVGQIELNAKNTERTTSVWAGQSISKWEDQHITKLFDELQQKIEWSKNRIKVDPGKYTVLLEPSAATDLLVYAYWESSARDADEGRTVFSSLPEGKKVFDKSFTIYSDPNEPGFECQDFQVSLSTNSHESVFDNGATISRQNWIEDGAISSLFASRHYASQSKRKPVYFTENLIFDTPGTKSTKEMIKDVEDGLLITCFWYIREVDPRTLLLTGLTRDGVFVIKNGEIIGAANNFRFNTSPIDMLKNVKATGESQKTLAREFGDYFKLTKVPPLLVENFNMSTKSDAL